jgi:hypothetical protein
MPFYTGKGVPGEPGFEMKEFKGFHVSSCGNFWGSEPFTPESEKEMRQWQKKREWKEKIKKLRINS